MLGSWGILSQKIRRVLNLLKLSGLVISFDKSRDYFVLLIIINLLVLFISYSQDVEIQYIAFIFCAFIVQLLKEFKHKKPHPDLDSIMYNGKYWVIKYRDGTLSNFTKIKIRLDTGFFILIAFYDGKITKNIVVFNDQISAMENRHLHILAKLMR